MRVYENIKLVESKKQVAKSTEIISQKKLRKLSFIFVCVLSFGVLGFSLSSLSLSREVKTITASWSPNIADLGKLKFVYQDDIETDKEALSSVEGMSMPFENSFAEEVSQGVFLINGLGGVIVKSCLDGKVSKIVEDEGTKTISVSHGKNLVSVYELLDTVGVKVGDGVKKNTPLGVSNSSILRFKMLYKGKVLAGLTVKDGELTFM